MNPKYHFNLIDDADEYRIDGKVFKTRRGAIKYVNRVYGVPHPIQGKHGSVRQVLKDTAYVASAANAHGWIWTIEAVKHQTQSTSAVDELLNALGVKVQEPATQTK